MDFFSPIQYHQIGRWVHALKDAETAHNPPEPDLEQRRPDNHSTLAFAAIGVLNLPPFINYTLIKSRAAAKAITSYETWSKENLIGRWTAPTLEYWDWKQNIITARSQFLGVEETVLWTRRLGLSSTSPLWTWITSGFLHEQTGHLVGNMLGLFVYAPICSRIPGMSALHVGAVTLGSSIAASAALLVEWRYRLPMPFGGVFGDLRTAMGASGIVCAFAALAAVAPTARLRIPILDFTAPVRVVFAVQLLRDLAGFFKVDEALAKPGGSWRTQPRVGYAAHLGGAVFGVVYYYAVLRNARSRSKDTGVRIENGTLVISGTR